MFIDKCPLRKLKPPLACNCELCDWYINDLAYNNCFWSLADYIAKHNGFTFTYEEISQRIGIPVQDIVELEEKALSTLRRNSLKLFADDLLDT